MGQRTMKAAVCHSPDQPISIDTVPVPTPVGREMLCRVKSASLCHSDISIISGAFGGPGLFPQIIGHEAVAVVEELGPDAAKWGEGFQVGDLVGAPLWHNMCLECTDCRKAGPQFCSKMQVKGMSCPGYFSEYTCVDAASAVVVSRGASSSPSQLPLSPRRLAPLFCAGITVWDALEQAHLRMGETVAVVGAGGLGQLAVQYAAALGARVIALDVRDAQLETVKGEYGAQSVINTSGLAPEALSQRVLDANNGELVDVAIVTSGVVPAYNTALAIVRSYGRVIAVGLPHSEIPISAQLLTARSLSLIGSHVPGQASSRKCLDFTLRKHITPLVNERRFQLEDLNEMIDLMKAGKVEAGRMVVDFF
ncbi:hypothetical protein AYO21_01584 [Fonsecaea monophora]|uniref:Enoyl reductase (ER) domain-containing protein n=1 Tax=Fonsecaea monophora TaxID=254056 RepID=A0A177FIW6_9EURO|nr:hypothetical protein AYO21_01584 [Fonsecaea monophora]KAH0835369.1 alcohol dehydrogenase [Fonsecaea pedrosoi]OAG44127.1 hypothetical protein AYO21_01584 [Fonsecaea monophora]